jgi:hypothetical protein
MDVIPCSECVVSPFLLQCQIHTVWAVYRCTQSRGLKGKKVWNEWVYSKDKVHINLWIKFGIFPSCSLALKYFFKLGEKLFWRYSFWLQIHVSNFHNTPSFFVLIFTDFEIVCVTVAGTYSMKYDQSESCSSRVTRWNITCFHNNVKSLRCAQIPCMFHTSKFLTLCGT